MTRAEKQVFAVKTGFVAFHAACLLALYTGVSWVAAAVAFAMYLLRALGVTVGFHRYFAHKSFHTSRPFQFLLALAGSLSTQGGLLWWVSHHRDHHRYTETEKDIHSPRRTLKGKNIDAPRRSLGLRGLWHAHMGWMMTPECFQTTGANVKDLHKYEEIKFLQRHYLWIIISQALALFGLGALLNALWPQLGTSGLQMLVWAYFISTVALWHATFAVNSVCHRWGLLGGRRGRGAAPFDTGDDSTNNVIVAVLAVGEGWHNNHHKFPSSARHGLFWWQFDLTWIMLRGLEKLGLVWDLKVPSAAQLALAQSGKAARKRAISKSGAGKPGAVEPPATEPNTPPLDS